MSHTTHALIALSVLVAAGCSGGGSGSSTAPTGSVAVSREDYALRLAEWLCDDLAACCDATQQPFDRDACVAVKREAELRRVSREEANSGRVFDEAMAATCVARLQETTADCGSERRVRECFRTYDGVLEIGEECTAKTQCRGSLGGDVACIGGRCAPRLEPGESCDDAPPGSGCDVCRPEASCREAEDGRHYCYATERRRGVAGDPCRRDFQLPTDPSEVSGVADCAFADGLYCSAAGVCEPFGEVGEACSGLFECGRDKRCVDGTCLPGLTEGETCRSSFGTCGAGLYCLWTDFVCTQPGSGPNDCTAYELHEGRCAVPAGEGEACGRFTECAEGLYCERAAEGGGTCVPAPSLCTVGLERLSRQSSRLTTARSPGR